MVAIAAFAARPVEAVQLEFLKDDRLLRRAQVMQTLMDDQMGMLADLDKGVLCRVASIVGLLAQLLSSTVGSCRRL